MTIDLGVHNLREAYASGALTVRQVIDEVLGRIAAAGDDKVWISRVPDDALRALADALDGRRKEFDELPLFGIPFAVKDNIDVAGQPTTAACPGFSYVPHESALFVRHLVETGAIVVGKTNLDQFATGLVGVRSPYGVPRNPFNAAYIPGGSSSGSAVAVAAGLVSFSLGTDTAGSGRVPAGFNNIVGLKPTPGRLYTQGIVPACKSLDCPSIFALSAADAAAVYYAVMPESHGWAIKDRFSFAALRPADAEFFGDTAYASLYAQAIERLRAMGGYPRWLDYAPFRDAAQLLYSGPWVAERTAAVGDFIARADGKAGLWPTTRDIIMAGAKYSAVDAFNGQYKLSELRERARSEMTGNQFFVLPTAGTIYTVADLDREPVLLNSNLGHYTNFVNFFGLSALALPAGFTPDGLPFGITLVGRPDDEGNLLAFGARWQRELGLPLGKTQSKLPPPKCDPVVIEERTLIAVVGAHMRDLPLNVELTARGGEFVAATKTAPCYRLFALPGGPPQRPGMIRVSEGGEAIDLEVWSLPNEMVEMFVSKIPPPLTLGTVALADGSVKGFLCESYATADAKDITSFGGWRAYLKSLS